MMMNTSDVNTVVPSWIVDILLNLIFYFIIIIHSGTNQEYYILACLIL